MKDSRIEWIGYIPNNWSIIRLKHIKSDEKYAIVDGPFGTAISTEDYVEEGIPLVRITNIKSPNISKKDLVYITEDHASNLQRSRLNKGDIVFAKTGATIGKCGINEEIDYGILSSSCVKIALSKEYNNKYFYYLFYTDQFNRSLRDACVGTTRDTINLVPFSNLKVCVPPHDEQDHIVGFLDKKVSEIDTIITKTKESIEEFKKLKQSIITNAVTKGLDPTAEMKESGFDYIGKIPAHWMQCRVRNIGFTQNGISKGGDYFGEGSPFVSYGDVYKNYALPYEVKGLVRSTEDEQKNYSVERGDIFFTRTSETIEEVGFSCVCEQTIPKAVFAGFLIRLRPYDDSFETGYLKYYFRSLHNRFYLVKQMNLVTRASLGQSLLKNMPVLIPSKAEQKEIATYLDRKCSIFDNILLQKEKMISELEQYKKALIYEYVTGKKEVA